MQDKQMDMQLKIKSVNDDGFFSGYGSVNYNKDSYGDIVMPGAFAKSLNDWNAKNKWPPVLFNHNRDEIIGCYTKMYEDAHGLYVEGRLLIENISKAREVHALLKAQVIDGLSIGYRTVKEEYDRDNDSLKLLEVKLYEVSIVTFPANDEARINCVKYDYGLPSSEQFKELLIKNGFNAEQAAVIHDSGFFSLSKKAAPTKQMSDIDKALQILRGD